MNPGKTTGHAPHERARGAHLDRERPRTPPRWPSPAERDSHHERHRGDAAGRPPGLRGSRSWPRSPRRSGCAGPRATCRPSSSASSTSSSWPTRRWPAAGGDLGDALRMVDAATFIDPVVPVESERAGRCRREEGHALAAPVVRRLGHAPDEPVGLRGEPGPAHRRRPAAGARAPGRGPAGPGRRRGRVPRPAAGRRLVGRAGRGRAWPRRPAASSTPPAATAGWSAASWRPAATPTASTPAPALVDAAELGTLDLRGEAVVEHLRAVAAAGLGGVVLSGMVDGMARRRARPAARRDRDAAGPGRDARRPLGDPAGLGGAPTPRPRPTSRRAGRCGPRRGAACWSRAATRPIARSGPGGADYLVTAVRAGITTPYAPARAVSAAAGRPVAVHQFIADPQPARRHRDAHAAAARRPARRPAGARRSSPRRSTTTWPARPTSTGCIPSTRPRATSPSTSSRRRRRWPGYLAEHGLPLILDFHNFTGPEYFAGWEPSSVARAAAAAEELALLAPRALLGLAKSRFSEAELARPGAGARRSCRCWPTTGGSPRRPTRGWRPSWPARRAGGGADILFVGRVVPSKAQHELVKALWAYRRLYDGTARLHLVGGTSSFEYTKALQDFVDDLGLSDAVRMPGEVSDAVAGRLLRRGRRVPLAVGARGVRRPAGRGDGGRRPGGDPRAPARWPTRWPTPRWCWPPPTPPTSPRPAPGLHRRARSAPR